MYLTEPGFISGVVTSIAVMVILVCVIKLINITWKWLKINKPERAADPPYPTITHKKEINHGI